MPTVSKSIANFTIEDFKSSIFSRGIGRAARFEVMIFPPTGSMTEYMDAKAVSLRCHRCETPHLEMETTDYRVGQGQFRKTVHNFNHGHTLTMSFYVDRGRDLYNGFMKWMNKAFPFIDVTSHDVGWYDDYTGQAVIRQLDETDSVRHEWALFEMYPIHVHRVHLDADVTNKAIVVEVEFAYRRAFIPPNGWDGSSPISTTVSVTPPKAIQAANSIDPTGDPTMREMARRIIPTQTTEQKVNALTTQIGYVDSNYTTINNKNAAWDSAMTNAMSVINNPDSTKFEAQAAYDTLSAKMTEYRQLNTTISENVMKSQQSYNAIKNELPATSAVPIKIAEMQTQYKEVSAKLVTNTNAFDSVSNQLQKIINPPATIVATAG